MFKIPRLIYIGWLIVGALLTTAIAFQVRTFVYEREAFQLKKAIQADFVPFTIESAIMYDYARQVSQGKPIAQPDPNLAGMENVPVASQMLLGLEYFLGWGYQLKNKLCGAPPAVGPEEMKFEDNPDFTNWVRLQMRLWICTVAGMIFLWLTVMKVKAIPAFAGAVAYAVAPVAIARYTGQDLIRGEFCMPFIIFSVLIAAWIRRYPGWYKFPLLFLGAFAAFAFWDAPQMFFAVWAGFEMLWLLGRGKASGRGLAIWVTIFAALLAAAFSVPYQRYHGLLLSPLTLVILPTLILMLALLTRRTFRPGLVKRTALLLGVALLLGLIWKLLPGYGHNYSHFGELVLAKLKFLNVKPVNPDLLSFDARILWTPALHSANWAMTKIFFPAILWLSFAGLALLFTFRNGRRQLRLAWFRLSLPLFMTVFFFVMYIFFVRAHVFCAIFMCLLFGVMLDTFCRAVRPRLLAWLLMLALAIGGVAWEDHITRHLRRDYSGMGLKEVVMLIQWFRSANVENMTVLTDMTLSPMLKGYCGARIVTQPQFELKATRDLVQEHIMLMYHGDEASLADFCRRNRVDILVFDRGNSYAAPLPIYSARYMAAARKVKPDAPAWFLEKGISEKAYVENGVPKKQMVKPVFFYPVEPPPKLRPIDSSFRIFRFIDAGEKEKADKAADLAEYFLQRGNPALARKMSALAYAAAPNSEKSYIAYYHAWNKPPEDPLTCLTMARNGDYERMAPTYITPEKKRNKLPPMGSVNGDATMTTGQ